MENRMNAGPAYPSSSKLQSTGLPYESGGLMESFHGIMYQLLLLMAIIRRNLHRFHDFRLAPEMIEAEKFDDIVLKYLSSNGWIWNFLQAKHKQDPTKSPITLNDIIGPYFDGPFNLAKYFISFYKIKFNSVFANDIINDFVIYTNTYFDLGPQKKEKQHQTELREMWRNLFSPSEALHHGDWLYIEGSFAQQVKFKNDNFSIQFLKAYLLTVNECEDMMSHANINDILREFVHKFRFVINSPSTEHLEHYLVKSEHPILGRIMVDTFLKGILDLFSDKSSNELSKRDISLFFNSKNNEIRNLTSHISYEPQQNTNRDTVVTIDGLNSSRNVDFYDGESQYKVSKIKSKASLSCRWRVFVTIEIVIILSVIAIVILFLIKPWMSKEISPTVLHLVQLLSKVKNDQ